MNNVYIQMNFLESIDDLLSKCNLEEITNLKNKVIVAETRLKSEQTATKLRAILDKKEVFYRRAHEVPVELLSDVKLVKFYIPLKQINPHDYYYYELYNYEGGIFDTHEFAVDETGLSLFADFEEGLITSKDDSLVEVYENKGYPYIFGYHEQMVGTITERGFYFDVEKQKVVMAKKKYTNKYDMYECIASPPAQSDDDEFALDEVPNFVFTGRRSGATAKYVYLNKLGTSKYDVVICTK